MPNSVSRGLCPATRTGSSRQFQHYPTTTLHVSFTLVSLVGYDLSLKALVAGIRHETHVQLCPVQMRMAYFAPISSQLPLFCWKERGKQEALI